MLIWHRSLLVLQIRNISASKKAQGETVCWAGRTSFSRIKSMRRSIFVFWALFMRFLSPLVSEPRTFLISAFDSCDFPPFHILCFECVPLHLLRQWFHFLSTLCLKLPQLLALFPLWLCLFGAWVCVPVTVRRSAATYRSSLASAWLLIADQHHSHEWTLSCDRLLMEEALVSERQWKLELKHWRLILAGDQDTFSLNAWHTFMTHFREQRLTFIYCWIKFDESLSAFWMSISTNITLACNRWGGDIINQSYVLSPAWWCHSESKLCNPCQTA